MNKLDKFVELQSSRVGKWLSEGMTETDAIGRLDTMFRESFHPTEIPSDHASTVVRWVSEKLKEQPQSVTVTITDSFNTTVAAPQSPTDAHDEDPHRFTLGNVLDLRDKLDAHRHFEEALATQNERLARQKVGKLTARGVAVIGCIMRKNIRQNAQDPGAVPFDAITLFCKRNADITANKAPADLAIGGAISILEAVGFLKQVRRADRSRGVCSAYKLLNEAVWGSAPPLALPPQ